jgi:hypothetical protein
MLNTLGTQANKGTRKCLVNKQNIKINKQYQLNTLSNTLMNLENKKQNQDTVQIRLGKL